MTIIQSHQFCRMMQSHMQCVVHQDPWEVVAQIVCSLLTEFFELRQINFTGRRHDSQNSGELAMKEKQIISVFYISQFLNRSKNFL